MRHLLSMLESFKRIPIQLPGMGLLFVQAVQNVDIPIMAAYLLMV